MKLVINRNYILYSIIVFLLLIDAMFLCVIKTNYLLFILYVIINIIGITAYCKRNTVIDNIVFSTLFMLFYTLFVDICIHYLGKKVIFEAEFLYIFALFNTCLQTIKNKKSIFLDFCFLYIPFNLFLAILSRCVDAVNYFKFMVNILTFVGYFYLFNNIDITKKIVDLYKYLFMLSSLMTLLQTTVGFSVDTRNGLFSVFGFGAYTIFIMVYAVYKTTCYIYGEESLRDFAIAIGFCTILYICMEAKAALMFVYINIILISIIKKGIPVKRLMIVIIGIMLLPLAYIMLLKFNPKFYYLTNIQAIIHYYTGNNSWKYRYGRFEAIKNVFLERDSFTRLFGVGFGSSTPLYYVFNNELGRNMMFPYYTNLYGYFYGYQHTSISTLLLDGGLVLACIIVVSFAIKFIKTTKDVYYQINTLKSTLQFGVMVYLIYYFTYANILKDFRAMAVTAIVFGINTISKGAFEKTRRKAKV